MAKTVTNKKTPTTKRPKKTSASGAKKSWHGRLTADADAATAKLLASLDVDVQLWRYDIAGSLAHAQMLSEENIITKTDFRQIKVGLHAVANDIEAGKLPMPIELEDIHMVIESALTARVGEAGKKLHTGRSRNDQVALDLRLWARDACELLAHAISELQRALVTLADTQGKIVFPAYTHLQRAQPILAGHGLLAYVEMFQRDAERLADARKRINVCPLGSGAVAGTSIPVNRARTAELLGFPAISRNSIDATASRDFLAELCFACAMLATHLSRWAEDWIIYSSTEFGLIELHDAYCTSSSMMPQKKNADTLELIRGKAASSLGDLVGMMSLMKSLPLAYGRDLQDDKRFAFRAVETMQTVLAVAPGLVATAKIREVDLREGFLDATALAEYLVNAGTPFRTAHHLVGQLVAQADAKQLTLSELLESDELDNATRKQMGPDVRAAKKHIGAANVVKHYAPEGAGGAKQLRKQLTAWKRQLK